MPPRKYTRQDVIDAALELLDEEGLDAVSIREVARRMKVNVNTVSFQVGTKARLLGLMSDAVLADLSFDDLPEDGLERAREVHRRYRRTLLSHRDGARLTAGNAPLEQRALELSEVVTSALSSAGLSDRETISTSWALFYFMVGLTQEQQAAETAPDDATHVIDGNYPTLQRLGEDFTRLSFDERFEHGIAALATTRDRSASSGRARDAQQDAHA